MSRRNAAEEVFDAIAHPARRAMLDALVEGDRTAGELGVPFEMTQPALSQHLRVLREAGLVRHRRQGRRRIYRLTPKPLEQVHSWSSGYERFWREKLDALEQHLENTT